MFWPWFLQEYAIALLLLSDLLCIDSLLPYCFVESHTFGMMFYNEVVCQRQACINHNYRYKSRRKEIFGNTEKGTRSKKSRHEDKIQSENLDCRIKFDRWPCHVTLAGKKAFFLQGLTLSRGFPCIFWAIKLTQ